MRYSTFALRRRGGVGLKVIGLVAVLAVAMIVLKGTEWYRANFQTNAWIYVDNTSGQPMEVYVDGSVVATVAPGRLELIKTRDGARQVKVTSGGETLFDESKQLEKPKSAAPSRYLLNPDNSQRYWIREVQYGIAVPKIRQAANETDRYLQTAFALRLVEGPGPWYAVPPRCDYLPGETIPEKVEGYSGTSKFALRRISPAEFKFFEQARKRRDDITSQATSELEARIKQLEERD